MTLMREETAVKRISLRHAFCVVRLDKEDGFSILSCSPLLDKLFSSM